MSAALSRLYKGGKADKSHTLGEAIEMNSAKGNNTAEAKAVRGPLATIGSSAVAAAKYVTGEGKHKSK